MTCNEAHDAMLVIDAAQLDDAANTLLGVHLRECATCRAIAETLGFRLGMLERSVLRRTRRRALVIALTAAVPIAAVLVAVASMRGQKAELVEPSQPSTASISVDVQPGQRATVINTKDPKVTIVWVTPAEGL